VDLLIKKSIIIIIIVIMFRSQAILFIRYLTNPHTHYTRRTDCTMRTIKMRIINRSGNLKWYCKICLIEMD